jgi:hypothetical protein
MPQKTCAAGPTKCSTAYRELAPHLGRLHATESARGSRSVPSRERGSFGRDPAGATRHQPLAGDLNRQSEATIFIRSP